VYRPLALTVILAAALLIILVAACGGSSSSESNDGDEGSADSDVPAGLSLVLFRDTTRNTVVAHSITDGRRWELSLGLEEFLVTMDCTRDGERAASSPTPARSSSRLSPGSPSCATTWRSGR